MAASTVVAGVGAAAAAGGLLSNLFGGKKDSGAEAARLQYAAAMAAIAEQRRALTEARTYMEPYYQGGKGALEQYGGELNIPGFAPKDPTAALRGTPGYQWMMDQGVAARDRSAAAGGRLDSGAQLRGLTAFGQGLGDQTYQQYLNRIGQMMTSGQNAAALQGGYGMQSANQIGGYTMAGGQALAQGVMNDANANQASYMGSMNNVMRSLGRLGGQLDNSGWGRGNQQPYGEIQYSYAPDYGSPGGYDPGPGNYGSYSDYSGGGASGFMYASGGPIPAGRRAIVGEKGPELFIPTQPGYIVPNYALGGNYNNYRPAWG
jgi:hypothetical protein